MASNHSGSVRDNKKLPTGWKMRYWCSQDCSWKNKSRKVTNPDDQRDNLGMKRFNCKSRLVITMRTVNARVEVFIRMQHNHAHLPYLDVAMPEAPLEYLGDHLEFKPNGLVKTLRPQYRNITNAQVYSAWLRLSEELEEAGEIDVFEITSVDGIVQLAWGMKKIAPAMKGYTVVEIGIDATYNTNSKGLELYGVLGKYDGAGYPLAYCLQTTASSTILGKRILALEVFVKQLRDKYALQPHHYHVDKDMAEIRIAQKVWPGVNVALCYWHLNRAVEEHLKKIKLSTTPYNFMRAHAEYSFIDLNFFPPGTPDSSEYEGGCLDPPPSGSDMPSATPNPNTLYLRIPATQPRFESKEPPSSEHVVLAPEPLDPDENEGKLVFCPRHLRQSVLDMMKQHYCAHPMIPGYSALTPEGIRYWAVKEIYEVCQRNDLSGLWAYLWENWYQSGRWQLWSRSSNPHKIPRLKTTMILEAHWKHLKHDYLDHFSNPRIDFLIWVVVVKAGRAYLNSFEDIMADTGRWTHHLSWQKDFKREWRRCGKTKIPQPINPKYRPDPSRWVCTCPYFASSRFLLCKHLVQAVHNVEPVFFWEVQRNRAAPWYTHPSLQPLVPTLKITPAAALLNTNIRATDKEDNAEGGSNNDSDDEVDEDNGQFGPSEPVILPSARAKLLRMFADGLEFQDQFHDHRFSKALERSGRSLFMMAEECLKKEGLLNSTRSARPLTWDSSLSQAMFWRARPPVAERNM
ncbi:hypothetical protein V5O48_016550 [Marasmius crinis-equi]|uniref:SWIM-type domain-containing protein n=1 Tax=Marasmius crinis-equi TaxID=585013 RepID=A0ABR3ERE0_9AGAR